jgi:hypothetical protein
VTVSTRSVRCSPRAAARSSRNPTTSGRQHVDRLPQHRGLGLDARPTPQPTTRCR